MIIPSILHNKGVTFLNTSNNVMYIKYLVSLLKIAAYISIRTLNRQESRICLH